MKVMGITAGRKGGNSEVLLKEALSACKEQGAEVSWINLHDFKVNPCTGCEGCVMNTVKGKKEPFCVWNGKDDFAAISNKMLEMDILIYAIPTYDLMPAGIYINSRALLMKYPTVWAVLSPWAGLPTLGRACLWKGLRPPHLLRRLKLWI